MVRVQPAALSIPFNRDFILDLLFIRLVLFRINLSILLD